MRKLLFLLLFFQTIVQVLFAQQPSSPSIPLSSTTSFSKNQNARVAAEICDNNLDDDGNGLADCEDFSCYFSHAACNCVSSDIIWVNGGNRLAWYNVQTGSDHLAATLRIYFGDIAWCGNGKLYGIALNTTNIYEINPYTGDTTYVSVLPAAYYAANGMVADYTGSIYFNARTINLSEWHVIKFNISTGNYTVIANLTASGLVSAGDLTFLNGSIYVACDNFKLAKINPSNGNIQSYNILNMTNPNIFGIVSHTNGNLYLGANDKLYRLDLATMQATEIHQFITNYLSVQGMSGYIEPCQMACKPFLQINTLTPLPYCSKEGVLLKAAGSGLGSAGYVWTLPAGTTIISDTVRAWQTGKYKVRYHTIPDTCGKDDSIFIQLIQSPQTDLGNDSYICAGEDVVLQSLNNADVTSYLWQDGSTSSQFHANAPGLYWLEMGNACGMSRDSITIAQGQQPGVDLGVDQMICPGTSVVLKNLHLKNNYDTYIWSNNSTGDSLLVSAAGIYWLESVNRCGVMRDSISVSMKDSCICNPVYPQADLGPDISICPGDLIQLKNLANQSGFRLLWQGVVPGNSYVVKDPGIYWVEVSNYCGTVADTIVIGKDSDCSCELYMPTGFTPNNDGKNDVIKPFARCQITGEIFIYNKWGEAVYHSGDLTKGWNGVYKGLLQSSNVFVYTIRFRKRNESTENFAKGTFVLIR